jgi:hypothetical protein
MRSAPTRLKILLKTARRAVGAERPIGRASSSTVSPNLDRHKDYEQIWAPVLDSIRAVVRQETVLSRAIGRLTLASATSPLEYGPVSIMSSGQLVPVSAQGALGIHGDILVRTVFDMCRDGADNVIELGSGWGHYLFKLWISGAPKDARYYACELTSVGRECAALLGSIEPDLKLQAVPFDYRRPEYGQIARGRKTVVYTSHSIEQVQTLGPDVITGLLDTADRVEGLHLEPVGWQVRRQRKEKLPAFSEQHEARCRKYEYNENLWTLLLALAAEGRIEITACVPDIIGVPYNPSTLIRWSKR